MDRTISIRYLNIFIFTLNLLTLAETVVNEVRCGSVDIRNTPKMAFQPRASGYKSQNDSLKYRDCTIIDGDITISMITQGNHTHDDYPVFENLREITGSILVFHVKGLMSLGKLFPNLRVIGGNSLIMNYALVIYQNQDLRQVNLTKLTTIKNGGVRITENAKLCYSKNINWEKIMAGKIRDYIVDQVAGRCESVCSVEDESVCERDDIGKPICWNPTTCQKTCKNNSGSLITNSGCTEAGEPCHPMCLGGCFEANNAGACYTCRFLDVEGVCVEKCPPNMFAMLKRRCLTREECVDLFPIVGLPINGREERKMWKAFQGNCHYECPRDYQQDPDDPNNCIKCEGYCPKICSGDTVDSVGSAMKFSKCNVIEGNLEVDMRVGMESTSGEKFTEAFGEIEQITGYLLIRFSTAFMSLHMFKRLKVIYGETLWKNMYALVVFENPNLRQLFQQNGIEITRGKVSFQNNRMLCYKTIMTFVDGAKLNENISESDVSSFSNGDKAICDEIPLEIKIISVYSYGFIVSWTPFNTTDMDHRKFLGYQIFYKKVDKEDYEMSIDDDRSACSDSWNMVFVTEGMNAADFPSNDGSSLTDDMSNQGLTRGELVNQGIESNSLYAVYVQTRLVNHPGAQNAISKIHFVRTTFAVPDPPRTISAVALDANTLKIQWELPMNPLGVISHYSFSWALDKPVPPSNETLLCTMRSQKNRKAKTIMAEDALSLSGTCPREQGCCKCEEGAKRPDSYLISHTSSSSERLRDEKSRSLEAQQEERAMFENTVQNAVFVQNCEVSRDPLRCPNVYQMSSPQVIPTLSPSKRDLQRPSRRSETNRGPGHVKKRHRRHEITVDQLVTEWQRYEYAKEPRVKTPRRSDSVAKDISSSLSTKSTSEKERRRRRSLKNSSSSGVELNALKSALDEMMEDEKSENFTQPATNSTKKLVDDMLLFDPYSKEVAQKLKMLEKAHPKSTILHVGQYAGPNGIEFGKYNVSTLSLVLTGLPHYSEYQINIYTCQDEKAVEHYCSSRPAWVSMKTLPIPEYDEIEASSVILLNVTDGKPTDRKIYWQAPKRPNGLVLTYRAKLFRDDDSTPLEQCIPSAIFENNSGIVFSGLSAGRYSLEVRVESSTEMLSNATIIENLFEIRAPTFFTLLNIVIILVACLVVLTAITMLCFYYANERINGKVEEYFTQNMSTNPEYLSQFEVYKADDWELSRNEITLHEQIGHGTFGMVRRGEGHDILSKCGVKFGPCAVKMIPGETEGQDRCHFLLEANVMKQFNTEFIVKLYGVVSNGVPVLVVMELMEKGNLRDFLRSLRPGAEENIHNRDPPSLVQYFTWAAQIADGMTYLETQSFCHRDLAARNCMVHADESVKIGDFGMARDIYYQEYYRPAGRRMMPVRWMAPESLKDGKFTTKSDVWSYGIVLYEMLTLGEQPYAGLANDEVFHFIVVDRRVSKKPTKCHPFWYSLMKSCWQYDSRHRPMFQQIVNYLKEHTTEEFRQLSFVINDLPQDKVCKEEYNFNRNDDCEEHHHRGNSTNNENYYREQEFYGSNHTNSKLHDADAENQRCAIESGLFTGEAALKTGMDGEQKLSIADRAMRKAREIGAPFSGANRRRNRRFNHNVDKWTVLATLLGVNPNAGVFRWGRGKPAENKETVNEAYGTVPVPPLDSSRDIGQAVTTRLQLEGDEEEEDGDEDNFEDDMDDEEDEDDLDEEEEEGYTGDTELAARQKAMMLRNINTPHLMTESQKARSLPQGEYIETEPSSYRESLVDGRPPSTTSSASSYRFGKLTRPDEPV